MTNFKENTLDSLSSEKLIVKLPNPPTGEPLEDDAKDKTKKKPKTGIKKVLKSLKQKMAGSST
jgi:hypothetical protein